MRQRRHSNWRCNRSKGFNEQEGSSTAGTGTIPLYSVQREVSRKAASSQPTPPAYGVYLANLTAVLSSAPSTQNAAHRTLQEHCCALGAGALLARFLWFCPYSPPEGVRQRHRKRFFVPTMIVYDPRSYRDISPRCSPTPPPPLPRRHSGFRICCPQYLGGTVP